jgi:glycosyltransferase involved in cell wall biosynthesis
MGQCSGGSIDSPAYMRVDVLPRISVIVCTRDRADSIGRTLASIIAQDYPDFEVLVVDQSRGSETQRLINHAQKDCRQLRYIRLERPGLSRAYNVGISWTRSQLLAFTDDDVTAPRDWLRMVALAFARHPQVGLLYGQVLVPPELRDREGRDGVTPGLPIPERRLLDRRHGFRVFGMGANFAARRQLFDRVGDFDEVLGGGGPLQSSQDFDFVYRVFRGGESTLLEPRVIVYHYGYRSNAEWSATVRSYGVGVGGFFFKHVRLGDAYAARLLLGFVAVASARLLKRCLTFKRAGVQWTYLANIFAGITLSFQFPIDRSRRLYRGPT